MNYKLSSLQKDKIFSIEAPEWLIAIQKFNKSISDKFKQFEPPLYLGNERQKPLFLEVSPILRGLVDTIGTAIKADNDISIPTITCQVKATHKIS